MQNIDQGFAEVQPGIIYAGSRLIAFRKPEQPAKTDTIELTYIPKQTVDRSRSSAKQRAEQRKQERDGIAGAPSSQALEKVRAALSEIDEEDDDDLLDDDEKQLKAVAKALNSKENPEVPVKIKFKSCKLDMSQVFPELMCPFGQTNEAKYN